MELVPEQLFAVLLTTPHRTKSTVFIRTHHWLRPGPDGNPYCHATFSFTSDLAGYLVEAQRILEFRPCRNQLRVLSGNIVFLCQF